jgi:hypothetical protein
MPDMNKTDWRTVLETLNARGFVHMKQILSPEDCKRVINLYGEENLFRNTVNMQRYRFGRGEYRYFNYPLPPLIHSLRIDFYKALVPLANEWMSRLATDVTYPDELEKFLSFCHDKDQQRPTPLLLRYETEGYNTLHQDIYGEVYFPFQVVFMLTEPGRDYDGGELVFVEQLPRAQSRAEVLIPELGDAVIFTTNFRPVEGAGGFYRSKMKHGVSEVKRGLRFSMGLILTRWT